MSDNDLSVYQVGAWPGAILYLQGDSKIVFRAVVIQGLLAPSEGQPIPTYGHYVTNAVRTIHDEKKTFYNSSLTLKILQASSKEAKRQDSFEACGIVPDATITARDLFEACGGKYNNQIFSTKRLFVASTFFPRRVSPSDNIYNPMTKTMVDVDGMRVFHTFVIRGKKVSIVIDNNVVGNPNYGYKVFTLLSETEEVNDVEMKTMDKIRRTLINNLGSEEQCVIFNWLVMNWPKRIAMAADLVVSIEFLLSALADTMINIPVCALQEAGDREAISGARRFFIMLARYAKQRWGAVLPFCTICAELSSAIEAWSPPAEWTARCVREFVDSRTNTQNYTERQLTPQERVIYEDSNVVSLSLNRFEVTMNEILPIHSYVSQSLLKFYAAFYPEDVKALRRAYYEGFFKRVPEPEIKCDPRSSIAILKVRQEFVLSMSWLSAVIGHKMFTSSANAVLATCNILDPRKTPQIIRKPSVNTDDLTIEEKKIAGNQFMYDFEKEGVVMSHVRFIPEWKMSKLFLRPDGVMELRAKPFFKAIDYSLVIAIYESGDDKVHLTRQYLDYGEETRYAKAPLREFISLQYDKLAPEMCGIYTNSESRIFELLAELKEVSPKAFSLLRSYLEISDTSVDLTSYVKVVTSDTTYAFCMLCAIAYYYPGMIVRKSRFQFVFSDYVMARYLVKKFFKLPDINGRDVSWRTFPASTSLKLFKYQEDTINRLIERKNRGELIWLPPGAGKTLIIMKVIEQLIDGNDDTKPSHMIWITSDSAVTNLKRQLTNFGLPSEYLNRGGALNKGIVTIIKHTELSHSAYFKHPSFTEGMAKTFLVIDEFHIIMTPGTNRSEQILLFARNAWRIIAMSGTPVKNRSSSSEIAELLSLCVDFPVISENVMVAMGAMISERVPAPSAEHKITYEIDCAAEEEQSNQRPGCMWGDCSFKACQDAMFERIMKVHIPEEKGIFVGVNSLTSAEEFADRLRRAGVRAVVQRLKDPYTFGPTDYPDPSGVPGRVGEGCDSQLPQVVVIPLLANYVAGYDMNRFSLIMYHVCPANAATMIQFFGRIMRANNTVPVVVIEKFMTMGMTAMDQSHEYMQAFADSLRDLHQTATDEHRKKYTEETKKKFQDYGNEQKKKLEKPVSIDIEIIQRAYSVFGVEYALSSHEAMYRVLRKAFMANILLWHPDKWTEADDAAKEYALEHSKLLTTTWSEIRDAFERLGYKPK